MPRRASNSKTRSRRRKRTSANRGGRKQFIIAVVFMVLVAAFVVGIILYSKYKRYTGYTVESVIEMSNSEENTEYYVYGRGYLKCAGDGGTYFNSDGIIWSENYSMIQPVVDICDDYVAVADIGQRNVFIYDRGGFVNRLNLSHNITDVEISRAGVIAVASNDGNFSFIEITDRQGNEIMTQKSVFSVSGYLMDISMSPDGSKLAAVFVSIDKGTLRSRVVFYDLSGEGGEQDIIAGTFDQYESVLLTTVRFMNNDRVCVVGDAGISIYRFTDSVELVYENLETGWEIQTLFFDDRYIGMIAEENESSHRNTIKVMDLWGNLVLNRGLDYSYDRADFAGDNVILYSYRECLMYSFAGVEKLYQEFDLHIEALKSADGRNFVYGTNANTQFIKLR